MAHATQRYVTGDSLPASCIRCRDPFTLTISAYSAIFKMKEVINKFFTLCTVFIKVISLIYEKIDFGDGVSLKGNKTGKHEN